MKTLIALLVVLAVVLSGCSSLKQAEITKNPEAGDGMQLIQHENVAITLYGDYLLHEHSAKLTMNWDNVFMTSFKEDGNRKPEMIFSSHTFAQPHCTLLCTVYEDSIGVSANVENYIRTIDPQIKHEEKEIGKQDYVILSYDLKDEDLEIYLFHIDYFLEIDGRTYRFSFWSSDRDRKWLYRESSGVLTLLTVVEE